MGQYMRYLEASRGTMIH